MKDPDLLVSMLSYSERKFYLMKDPDLLVSMLSYSVSR